MAEPYSSYPRNILADTKPSMQNKAIEKEYTDKWKKTVIDNFGDLCECCGCMASTAHHYIPKGRNKLLKYCVENGVPLCNPCHYTIHFSPSPDKVRELCGQIRTLRGKKWADWIDQVKEIHGQSAITKEYYKNIGEYLNSYE